MLNRRDFLTRVIGASAAALVLPHIELLAARLEPAADTLAGPAWSSAYSAVHAHAYRLFCDRMAAVGIDASLWHDVAMIGAALPNGAIITNQLNVGFDAENITPEGTLIPAISALANGLIDRGVDQFGCLLSDLHGPLYADSIGPLRMVVVYNVNPHEGHPELMGRFDIVGAQSEAGHRRANLRKQQYLKNRLTRKRLHSGPVLNYPIPS